MVPLGARTKSQQYGTGHCSNLITRNRPRKYFDVIGWQPGSRAAFISDKVIGWIQATTTQPEIRPTVPETCAALLQLLSGDPNFSQGQLDMKEDDVLKICSPLVRVSETGNKLDFSHQTTKVYFESGLVVDQPRFRNLQPTKERLKTSREELTRLSLKTHIDPDLALLPSTLAVDSEKIKQRAAKHPFYGYAAAHWNDISQGLTSKFTDAILSVFSSKDGKLASWVLEFGRRRHPEHLGLDFVSSQLYSQLSSELVNGEITPLHVAAALSLAELCSKMKDDHLNVNKSSLLGTPLYCALVGSAALAPRLAEPPWRRFRHYGPRSKDRLAETVRCLLNLGADCRKSVQVPDLPQVSIATQALYTCAWLEDADLFIRIVSGGAPLDGEFRNLVKSGAFRYELASLMDRPVRRQARGKFREFLTAIYSFLLGKITAAITDDEDENDALNETREIIRSSISIEGLECDTGSA